MTDAKMLTFKDFFPEATVTKIKSGTELFLAYSLNKYCLSLLGKRFSIADVAVDKHVCKSGYMAFLRHYAYATEVALPFTQEEEAAWMASFKWANYFAGSVSDVVSVSETDEAVTYSFVTDVPANRKMISAATSTAYVSLLAYWLVRNYRDGTKKQLIIDNSRKAPVFNEYSDLIILKDYGNKLVTPVMCTFIYAENEARQPDYEAYVAYNRQLGYMSREYSPIEKFKVCNRIWNVGDPVLVYKKRDTHKAGLFKPLNACVIGIIRRITKDGIEIDEIPCAETKLTQRYTVDVQIERNPTCYTMADKYSFAISTQKYGWNTIGVSKCTYSEPIFITEIFDEDGANQWVTEDGVDKCIWMGTRDVVYAVLTDRGISWNKDAYVSKYFTANGKAPIFDQYVSKKAE